MLPHYPADYPRAVHLRRARAPEEEVLREALINLVGHQDYTDVQRTATVLWWRDRAVFTNPGDSYVATADLWAGGFSETRNPLIIRLLRQAGLAEQAGSGLPFIRRTWAETGRPTPGLQNDAGRKRFELTFLWGEGVNGGVNGEVENSANGSVARQIVELLTSKPGLRVPELANQLGVSVRTVERAVRRLKDEGRITFRGAARTGGYHLL